MGRSSKAGGDEERPTGTELHLLARMSAKRQVSEDSAFLGQRLGTKRTRSAQGCDAPALQGRTS